MQTKYGFHNFFDIEVRDAKTNEVKQKGRAENVVLNQFGQWFLGAAPTSSLWKTYQPCSGIAVGSGTGTFSPTRTAMFNQLTVKKTTRVDLVYDFPTSYATYEITIGTAELNGSNFTEVGFVMGFAWTSALNYPKLMTHAAIKDSEGNTISIPKTELDIVIIRGTFFVTILDTVGFGVNGGKPLSKSAIIFDNALGITETQLIVFLSSQNVLDTACFAGRSFFDNTPEGALASIYTTRYYELKGYSGGSYTLSPPTVTSPLVVFSETEGFAGSSNLGRIVRAIGVSGGCFNFPNHDVFAPYLVSDKILGSGNGILTDFSLGCPEIMENSESIYVSNVLKTKNVDYTIDYSNNCFDQIWEYHSAMFSGYDDNVEIGNLKTAAFGTGSESRADPIAGWACNRTFIPTSVVISEEQPVWFDFTTDKKCNKMVLVSSLTAGQLDAIKIKYSSDNVVWNDVAGLERTSQTYTFTAVAARYWKIFVNGYSWTLVLASSTTPRLRLGFTSPGLHFLTPPPADTTIKATYSIEYPFKTANNILRFQSTYVFGQIE